MAMPLHEDMFGTGAKDRRSVALGQSFLHELLERETLLGERQCQLMHRAPGMKQGRIVIHHRENTARLARNQGDTSSGKRGEAFDDPASIRDGQVQHPIGYRRATTTWHILECISLRNNPMGWIRQSRNDVMTKPPQDSHHRQADLRLMIIHESVWKQQDRRLV